LEFVISAVKGQFWTLTMVEVILLSSSAPPSPVRTKAGFESTITRRPLPKTFDFDLDDFDDAGSLEFGFDRPPKKVRLSPALGSRSRLRKPSSATERTPGLNFDFSSDKDATEFLGETTAVTSLRASLKKSTRIEVVDDIAYSSSAPEPLPPKKTRQNGVEDARKFMLDDFFDDDLGDPTVRLSQAEHDDTIANLLPSLTQAPSKRQKGKCADHKPKARTNDASGKATTKDVDDIECSSPVKPKSSKSSKLSEAEKAARAAQKAAAKADKEAAREAEKARKAQEKEQKGKEKQKAADLAEVNKSRTNKKDATPEMIVEMSSLLKDTSVGTQVEKRMENVQVEVNYIDEEVNLTDTGGDPEQYGNIITWRRKVQATYNDEEDQWEPTSRCRVVKEKHILIHMPAGDFAAVAAASGSGTGTSVMRTEEEMKANLDAHVKSIRRRFGDCIPVYLIEGLRSWLKKNLNAKNRAYTAGVRAQMLQADADTEPAPSQARGRKRKKPLSDSLDLSHVTSDLVDDLLLHLQLAHQPILIHHSPTTTDSASQISALTQHLATRPYRVAQLEYNLKSASFCMDGGQVRTGDDAKDTFVKMLQEVQRVTPSMAYGIVEEFKTIRKLVKGFDKHGNLLLEDVRKTVNKDGGWSDKRLGPQVSKRLFKVFMGRDPAATDGMS
jgi:crossover junction endonuclease EME1